MRALQRGGFLTGLVVGLLVGLGVALAVALYITKAPVPFINKLPQRTADQDAAETQKNRNWDPNAALAGKNPARAASTAASGAVAPALAPTPPPPVAVVKAQPAASAAAFATSTAASTATNTATRAARDPAALLAGKTGAATTPANAASKPGAEGFQYWVQAGAYARTDDAEAQRAKLALIGLSARVMEREQSGRTVYRVRVGPFEQRGEAEATQTKLSDAGVDANLVRVER